MTDGLNVARRRQFCALCGQLMFEFFSSPDGHFGLVNPVHPVSSSPDYSKVRCPTCGAAYRLLARLNAMGAPVERR
jgi:ribosomal protein S27AE